MLMGIREDVEHFIHKPLRPYHINETSHHCLFFLTFTFYYTFQHKNVIRGSFTFDETDLII